MRLLDRLTGRYSTRVQGYYEGMASGAAVLMTYGADARREVPATQLVAQAQQALGSNGVVAAISVVRMMLLGEAVFKLRNKVDKSLYGTEDLRILEYPWPNGTSGDLWARMSLDIDAAGNAFIWKAEPNLLVRLPPSEVTIVSEMVQGSTGSYRRVLGYDWDPSRTDPVRSSQAQFFTVDEVAHWAPIPDELANFRGRSWLSPVLREVAADSGLVEYKNQYVDHGSPIIAVKYPLKLRPDTIDSVIERMQVKYGGLSNAFKPLVFDQGADPLVGAGLQELDYAAVQAAGTERICAAAGIHPLLLGLSNARQPGAAYQDAKDTFANFTARPLWRSGCAALQKLVPNMPPRGVELWFDTSDIAALQAAETERAQVIQVELSAVLTGVQAGYTRESVVGAVASGDVSQLKPDPNAPPPGQIGQRAGSPPGGGQTLTKTQNPASKTPMPDSFTTPAFMGSASAKNPTVNGY